MAEPYAAADNEVVPLARCRIDSSVGRVEVDDFAFPLGVYPIEAMNPLQGYTLAFEPADGSGEDGEWEEWPDRYVFDILITATRLESMCRALFAMLPGRIYPILDVLGHDDYREVDPYVSYELVGQERFQDGLRRFRGFLFEDGLVGFGAMSEEPFLYVFVDEHKIVTVRAETALREKVESVLAAFDLTEVEEIAGADAATHEHRGVLDTPDDRPDLLTAEEIVEELREDWGLVLNVDAERNIDDEENDLGITGWRCVLRHEPSDASEEDESEEPDTGAQGAESDGDHDEEDDEEEVAPRYAEVYLTAESLAAAEQMLWEALESLMGSEAEPELQDVIVSMDRMTPEHFAETLQAAGGPTPDLSEAKVWHSRWLE